MHRDLAMIKVACTHETRPHILGLVDVFRARVIDLAIDSIIMEITGQEEKIDRLIEVLRPYGLMEMVRTGIVSMRRGSTAPHVKNSANPQLYEDTGVSYSV